MPMNLKPVPSRLEIAKDILTSLVTIAIDSKDMSPLINLSLAYADALISKEKEKDTR
jgi:hypothetical protein